MVWRMEAEVIDEKRLSEIEERAKAATAGPWHTVGNTLYLRKPTKGRPAKGDVDWFAFPGNADTANFIAHSREDVPQLVAEVRRLRAIVSGVENEMLKAGVWYSGCSCRERLDAIARLICGTPIAPPSPHDEPRDR